MNVAHDLARAEFYQTHLNRVSRSFAFCIARLEGVLRERVGLSYLLCRLLDTIEDAAWETFEAQMRSFSEFGEFLWSTPSSSEVLAWVNRFPSRLPDGERLLLADAERMFRDVQSWPEETRVPIARLISSMSGGMSYFMAKKHREGRLVLHGIDGVNRYCFFVAGLVGEMLTHFTGDRSRLLDAFRFGLFLQKVNLLKDQHEDEKAGRYLVPSRQHVLVSLRNDAQGAFRFLCGIPKAKTDFRLFCAWSLFLGLATVGAPRRISREETMGLVADVEKVIHDNQGLHHLFEMRSGPLFPEAASPPVSEPLRSDRAASREELELLAFYEGGLSREEVLGLFRDGLQASV